MHNLKWYTDRIGKKIKRDKISDCCETCRKPNEFIIADKDHAYILHMESHELNIEYYA